MRYSIIHHDIREKFALTIAEYLVCDSIHQLSYKSPYTKSMNSIAEFLGMSEKTVRRAKSVLIEKDLITEVSSGIRTTDTWIEEVISVRDTDKMSTKVDKMSGKSGQNVQHTIIKNIKKNKYVAEPSSPPTFSFKEYLEKMRTDKRPAVRFIAFFFKKRRLTFDSEEQVKVAIKRHIRAATDVVKFGETAVNTAVKECERMESEDGIKWTIETILKVLTK